MIRLDVMTPQDLCSLYHILLNHCVVQQCVQGHKKFLRSAPKLSLKCHNVIYGQPTIKYDILNSKNHVLGLIF